MKFKAKKGYSEMKYGKKISYKSSLEKLKEVRAKNNHVIITGKYAPYTQTKNNNTISGATGNIIINPETITEYNSIGYTVNFLTLAPLQYFGVTQEVESWYFESALGSMLDMKLMKDFLNGRIGSWYLLFGGGMRANFQQSNNEFFLKPLLSGKIGMMITDSVNIWLGADIIDKVIVDDAALDQIKNELYELNFGIGVRF